jgi:hypothetical protein
MEECSREREPLAWASRQNSFGCAQLKLGERVSGTAHLEQALAAFGAVLEVWSRDREPLGWAIAQNNLGETLLALAERERSIARLEATVAAYRAGLEVAETVRHQKLLSEVQGGLARANRLFIEFQS